MPSSGRKAAEQGQGDRHHKTSFLICGFCTDFRTWVLFSRVSEGTASFSYRSLRPLEHLVPKRWKGHSGRLLADALWCGKSGLRRKTISRGRAQLQQQQ
jgi:hypothetical protein